MEHLEKTPIRKPIVVLKCILGPILLIIIAFLTSTCVQEALRFRSVTSDPLTLQAYITHVETIIDTENGDAYDAMMRYSYGGETYVDTYRRFSREAEAELLVGKTVTIRVDPDSPGTTLEEMQSDGTERLLFAALFMAGLVVLLQLPNRESYVQTYGWRREAVKKDMISSIVSTEVSGILLMPILLYYSVTFCFADVYFQPSFGDVIALCFGAASLYLLWQYIGRLRLIHQDLIRLSKDTFVSKRIDVDYDGPDTYYVTYENSGRIWEQKVKRKVYEAAGEGTVIDTAYIVGETRPVLSRSHHGDTF